MKPQMTQEEVQVLENILVSFGDRVDVLEWGSGGSTVYFTKFLKENNIDYTWTSIEYNLIWFNKIKESVKDDPKTNIILFDVGNTQLKQRYTQMDDYISYPSKLDKKYDLIIVDGRKRRRCLVEASKVLKPSGVVLLHDARRTYYHCAFSLFPDSRILLRTGLWQGKLEDPGILLRVKNLLLYWCFRVYTFSFRFR